MYYFVINKKAHVTLYGPYESDFDAAQAAYFYKPIAERDAANLQRAGRVFLSQGISGYDAEELEAYVKNPTDWGYKSFVVKPREELRVHPSWKARDLKYRLWIRDSDFKAWW